MVSDLNKNIGGSMDLEEKRHGLADLHTPIHPPPPPSYTVTCVTNAKKLRPPTSFDFRDNVCGKLH